MAIHSHDRKGFATNLVAVTLLSIGLIAVVCQLVACSDVRRHSASKRDGGVSESEARDRAHCREEAGEFFDFRTEQCVVPSSEQDARVLSGRNYLLDLASPTAEEAGSAETPNLIRARVIFSELKNPSQWNVLMADLEPSSIVHLNLYFPTVDYGTTLAFELEQGTGYQDALEQLLALAVAHRKANDAATEEIQTAFANREIGVWFAIVEATSESLLAWWQAHEADVFYIQPVIGNMDDAQPVLFPH